MQNYLVFQPPFKYFKKPSTKSNQIIAWASNELSEESINTIWEGEWGGEEGKKIPPTSFSPVATTNVEISLQKFAIFSFNPFATLA